MKRIVAAMLLALALSACGSLQRAPEPQQPKRPPVPSWIMEPAPNLRAMLDKIISPYSTESTKQSPALERVKTN